MRDYTKIKAWQLADDLTVSVYEQTRSFPREEFLRREHANRQGMKSIDWKQKTIASFDTTVIVTVHRRVDDAQLLSWSRLIVDTRNVYADDASAICRA